MMNSLFRDLRFGGRLLAKKPAFAVTVVTILALSIGVTTAVFSLANALLFKPLLVFEPHRIVNLYKDRQPFEFDFSYTDYQYYRDRNDVFSGLLAFALFNKALTSDRQSEAILGNLVSGNYFDVLGVKASLGRTFLPEEDRVPNRNPVAVISHSLWERRFNRDPRIIGRSIKLNGHDFIIIGVADAGFKGLHWAAAVTTDVWTPLSMVEQLGGSRETLSCRSCGWLELRGRLKKEATTERAQTAIAVLKRQLEMEQVETSGQGKRQNYRVKVIRSSEVRFNPITDEILRPIISGFSAVACLVLLIAWANLSGLLLTHAVGRGGETAIRSALGASRGRLARQLLTETIGLSILGGVAGLLLARWITGLIASLKPIFPTPATLSLDVSIDIRVLVFTFLVCLLTGVICGLIPFRQVYKVSLKSNLTGEGVSGPANQKRYVLLHWLIVPQISLSLLLLLISGLFLRSLYKAKQVDLGFDPNHAVSILLDLGLHGYDEGRGKEFYRVLLEQTRQLPGITSASLADWPPLDSGAQRIGVYPESSHQAGSRMYLPVLIRVTPGFLETVGISLIRGRDFTERDIGASPYPVLINETVADNLWPGQEAIGKKLVIKGLPTEENESLRGKFLEVVGVVKNTKIDSLSDHAMPYLYMPFEYYYTSRMRLIASSRGNPTNLFGPLKRLISERDPNLTTLQSTTLNDHIGFLLHPIIIAVALTTGFGSLGLALSGIGIYGVTAHSVSQRTREIGIRMAMGAGRGKILWMMIAQGMKLALLGSAAGLLIALFATRFLSSLLFGVEATDMIAFIVAPLVLSAVTLLACYISAHHAAKIDPVAALRHE